MIYRYSRRQVLQACSAGLGASVAGCTSTNGQPEGNSPTETDGSPTEAETETETHTTPCSTNYPSVMAISEEELEDEPYEKQLYEDLSSTQQDQFKMALNDGQPPISDKNESNWYRTTTYQGKEHRTQLVIEYETELYKTEVHHVDHC